MPEVSSNDAPIIRAQNVRDVHGKNYGRAAAERPLTLASPLGGERECPGSSRLVLPLRMGRAGVKFPPNPIARMEP